MAGNDYGHAWAEVTIEGKTHCIHGPGIDDAEDFYAASKARAVKRYTAEEATEIGCRRGATYGPWDHAEIDKAEAAFGASCGPRRRSPPRRSGRWP